MCLAPFYVNAQSLSGTYTINPSITNSRNFSSFQGAIASLEKNGVSGPVRIEVDNGTYSGPFTFKPISGTSLSNTVTFYSPHVDSVHLRTASSSSSSYVIKLDSVDYLTFENFRISKNLYGAAVLVSNKADHNTLKGCLIEMTSGSAGHSTSGIGILFSNDARYTYTYTDQGNYNSFINNTLIGGYVSIVMNGTSTNNKANANKVISCDISESRTAIRALNQDSLIISNCYVHDLASSGYGLFLRDASNIKVTNNEINSGTTYNYLYNLNANGYNGISPSEVSNNIFISKGGYACYFYRTNYTAIVHNSFSNTGAYTLYLRGSTLDIRNNNFYQSSIGGSCLSTDSNSTVVAWDYNNYHAPSGSIANINGRVFASIQALAVWNRKYNQHNWDQDPGFKNLNQDLRLSTTASPMLAPLAGIGVDIDGDPRCNLKTSIGADEYSFSPFPPTAYFNIDDTVMVGSYIKVYNGVTRQFARCTWLVNGQKVSDSFHFDYIPASLGKDSVSLIFETCSGSDTFSQTTIVVPPSKAPEADFYVKRKGTVQQLISLLDLTENGPSKWNWDVSPKSAYNYNTKSWEPTYEWLSSNDSTSATPYITFLKPGEYDIKLVVSNSVGKDSLTKGAALSIDDRLIMCSTGRSNAKEGILYDDGGQYGFYSYADSSHPKICTTLISSCSGRIEFELADFDLGKGDYLRIYDGYDATGRPLWNTDYSSLGMKGDIGDKSIKYSFTAKTGTAYIEFERDSSSYTISSGFAIEWKVKPTSWPAPLASFNVPDTACIDYRLLLENTSIGNYSYAEWDIDADSIVEQRGDTFSHKFKTAGTRTIGLYLHSACAATDTIIKQVLVEKVSKAPRPVISASRTIAEIGDTITLSVKSTYCTNQTKWNISPSNYVVLEGSVDSDQLKVYFTKKGAYTLEVEQSNANGSGKQKLVGYISIIQYCVPYTLGLDKSLGISRVSIGAIDNSTSVGSNAYEYYNEQSTTLEVGQKYPFVVERKDTSKSMSRKVWIDWNIDGDFDDSNELIAHETAATTQKFQGTVKVPSWIQSGTTRMRITTNYSSQSNSSCGPHQFGEFEDYKIILSDTDKVAPALNLYGSLDTVLTVYSKWSEPGFLAIDGKDGNISSTVQLIGIPNTNRLGTYEIEYLVLDKAGNSSRAKRIVKVIDDVAPTISLNGPTNMWLQLGNSFTDPLAKYDDNYDKYLSLKTTGKVNDKKTGTYTVEYCVTDSSGNGPICLSRTVVIGDTVPPVITLLGSNPKIVDVLSTYTEDGYSVDEPNHYRVVTSGTWKGKTDVLGSFTQKFTAIDTSGNIGSATRTIEVVDREAPEIVLTGPTIDSVERYDTYTDPGVTITDNYYQLNELTTTVGGTFTDTEELGTYLIEYKAQDPSGNVALTVSRVVVVWEDISIDEQPNAVGVELYPNPSTGQLYLHVSNSNEERLFVEVVNTLGQMVQENNLILNGQQAQLNVASLPSGVYMLVLQTENTQVALPFRKIE